MYSIKDKTLKRIQGKGVGWVFSQKDFLDLGSRSSIDFAFDDLLKEDKIRRVIRGIYDYPKYSQVLEKYLGPDIDQVAQALSRKFNWRIQPSGSTALNILGLSTQVPGKYIYLSDGPNRDYKVNNISIEFKQTPLKEAGFKSHESGIIVQAIKSLGKDRISDKEIQKIRNWLDPKLNNKVLKDTRTVTGWIYEVIRQI